jgi:hypothetical protein
MRIYSHTVLSPFSHSSFGKREESCWNISLLPVSFSSLSFDISIVTDTKSSSGSGGGGICGNLHTGWEAAQGKVSDNSESVLSGSSEDSNIIIRNDYNVIEGIDERNDWISRDLVSISGNSFFIGQCRPNVGFPETGVNLSS